MASTWPKNCVAPAVSLALSVREKSLPGDARGDVRCYCNDASCVSTGYMCKSPNGRCFSQLSYDAMDTKSQHGCVESLPDEDRRMCESRGGDIIKNRNGPDVKWPLLMCCNEDMCNYQENVDINIASANDSHRKDKAVFGADVGSRDTVPWTSDGSRMTISQRDLWFKAAVIAVPIAGGFILVMLVLLAIRMLRTDSRRQRHLVLMRQQSSLTKARLYVADHFQQQPDAVKVIPSHQDCVCPVHSKIYVNKLDKKGYEKIRPWSEEAVSSVVTWSDADHRPGPLLPATDV
ncbi:hypothetical protein CAPTEDRAFT_220461 [Capitella teleta]|uniref:BMP and activin membrane-bound inhibitor homolog n=1 Tax=Capitella teleta TaxID=283909 RepID=R7TDA4_CAPTE|nr:hypothetical protein CAPTEDRAFT_220461 [Capitella teleta]|eukprot:ELT89046.1 hypothetical protein CAPTEDRAFT_220461 [Capitella teleta]